MYGGVPFGGLPYGATFGGVIVMPEICNVTDWAVNSILSSSWSGETLLSTTFTVEDSVSSTWTRRCDGDQGSVT